MILPAVAAVASFQAGAALHLLAASEEARARFEPFLLDIDVWSGLARRLPAPRDVQCPCCAQRQFPFLLEPVERSAVSLCGRNTVQVRPQLAAGDRRGPGADLARIAERVRAVARELALEPSLLAFDVEGVRFTVFSDGRALIEGTQDVARARALYDRWVGA